MSAIEHELKWLDREISRREFDLQHCEISKSYSQELVERYDKGIAKAQSDLEQLRALKQRLES